VNLFEVYEDRAHELGNATAITYATGGAAGTELSWVDLVSRAGRLATVLGRRGVVAGSRCAVVLADLPDAIPVLLAVWARNAVAVLVDPLWGEETRQTVLRHSGAEYLLTIGSQACVSDLRGSTLYRPDRPELPASTAVLAYTSGSTGAPKGIALPHDRVISGMLGAAAVLDHYRERPSTCFGSSIRLSGFGVLALHFLWSAVRGSSVVVLPRLDLTSAGRYWRDLDEHRIDLAVLVAPLVELLLRSSRIRPGAVPPLFINSSGPLSERAHTRFHDQFGAWILNCYGLTECCFAITMGDTSLPGLTTLSVGRPYQVRVRLRAADGAVVTGPGEGEVEFWGPLMSDGYYDDPTATAAAMNGRWMRSGDLGRRDESGRYWIVGRLKHAVMKGGQTVYLNEVEEACLDVPGVGEAIAVRTDIGGGGEDIGLLVRSAGSENPDEAEVRRELEVRLGRERAPRRVLRVDGPLPRIGQHKPDRRAAQLLWNELTAAADGGERR